MFIKFEVDDYRWVTHEADTEDKWDRGSTDADVSICSATVVPKDGYDTLAAPEGIKEGDMIFLVWARYGTGDSFGSDGGQYELLEVCKSAEDAQDRKQHYLSVKDFSVPWSGYFEWLQEINIEEFKI